jgi:hypothetical protein
MCKNHEVPSYVRFKVQSLSHFGLNPSYRSFFLNISIFQLADVTKEFQPEYVQEFVGICGIYVYPNLSWNFLLFCFSVWLKDTEI